VLTTTSSIRNLLIAISLVILLTSAHFCHGQVSTEGRDFWFGFMNSWLQDTNNPIFLEVYISANDSTSGTLSIPKDPSFTPIKFSVVPGITTRLFVPTSEMPTGSDAIENKGIHVVSDDDVSVFAMNQRTSSADMTGISPTYSLGNKYIVLSHWENDNGNNNVNSNSEFVIASIANGTKIEITPSVSTLGGKPALVPFTVSLNEGQIYEIQAHGDLTGTKITATNTQGGCQNFALFAGNQYTLVGPCVTDVGHDHLYAQQYPIDTWGTEFITVGLEGHPNGDVIKILASVDNTTVHVNSSIFTLNEGQVLSLTLAGVNNIKADKPITVGQFCRSQGCNGEHGDPFYIVVSPVEQMLKKITFVCPSDIFSVDTYQINIITRTSNVSSMQLDLNSISANFSVIADNPDYSYAIIHTTGGSHTLESADRFIAYVYGFGDHVSFGYSAGASLENLNINVLITDSNGHILPSDNLCHNDQIFFTPIVDGPNHFEWSFSDGKNEITNNKNPVDFTFTKEGKYVLTLKVSVGGGNCAAGKEDTYVKVIQVVNPKSKIVGPRSICPNTNDVLYTVDKVRPYTYDWSEGGGTISQNKGDSILIDWGATNANAFVKLQAHNDLGCYGDLVTQPVTINIKLHPEAPFGPDTLCANDMQNIRYDAFDINGYTYDWNILPGTIDTGQGKSSVTADWSTYGIGEIWFIQSASTSDVCSGSSDTLRVYIQRDPSTVASITTLKDQFQIGETIEFTINADPLYQMINWNYGDNIKLDSVAINPTTHAFLCSGMYDVAINVYDTIGICPTKASGLKQIEVLPVSFEMIQVTTQEATDSVLQILWKTQNGDFLNEALKLNRRKAASSDSWQTLVTVNGQATTLVDKLVQPTVFVYEYELEQTSSCPDQNPIEPQNNILLKAKSEDNITASLTWNPYLNWTHGVDEYEIYLKIDKGEFIKIGTSQSTDYAFPYDSLGFDYCFRVKALESSGNNSFSWSDISCTSFVPQVTTYNVITPNNDPQQANEIFYIDKIEFYPNNSLTIYNRWGNKVKEFKGYKNEWPYKDSQDNLSTGVYFFVLDLNDKRATQSTIKGTLSILR
jgi:gliding motility-associated-like protein